MPPFGIQNSCLFSHTWGPTRVLRDRREGSFIFRVLGRRVIYFQRSGKQTKMMEFKGGGM